MKERKSLGAILAEELERAKGIVGPAQERVFDQDKSRSECSFSELKILDALSEYYYLYPMMRRGLFLNKRLVSGRSYRSCLTLLWRGFIKYLDGRFDIKAEDMDGLFFSGFIRFIEGLKNIQSPSSSLGESTKASIFFCPVAIFKCLLGDDVWSVSVKKILDAIPANPWPYRNRKHTPRERLETGHLQLIWQAAEKEAFATIEHWERAKDLIYEGRAKNSSNQHVDFRDLPSCLAYFNDRFGKSPIDNKWLKENFPDIYRVVYISNDKRNIGLKRINDHLYPNGRRLVAFVVLLAVSSALNPESVVSLRFRHLSYKDVFGVSQLTVDFVSDPAFEVQVGEQVISVSPPKPRAVKPPSADLSRAYWEPIFEFLKEYTLAPRGLDPLRLQDFVFNYFGTTCNAASFANTREDARSGGFFYALEKFIEENGLEPFSLAQIRATVLDEDLRRSGDLVAVSRKAGHRSIDTLVQHYTSDGTRKWYREKLGEVLLLRDRWVETSGKIDPRSSSRSSKADLSSATPGFMCLDPFDSPREGQARGKLCQAYGECPSCPLAVAKPEDPLSVSFYFALLKAINESRYVIPVIRWDVKWDAVVEDLSNLISLLGDEVVARSDTYSVKLPGVS
ncbi:hypothetical protein [Pseudomonas putida]|uniref:hypothetical protein n=1 Tax=Pseudomonas putida TaxID=303 RepID=UPI0012BC15DC|nr:hypothetical protein [Pseudomonas putida]